MSDLSQSPPPEPALAGTKRKSTAGTSTSKRAKTQSDPFADTKNVVQTILASPESFSLPSGDVEYRKLVVSIAQYAKSLEGSSAVAGTSKAAPPPKTPEQVSAEAERITSQINRGVSKLMAWKPSCKTGSAKYAFDGVCTDPRVFGKVLGLDGPPNFKTKKYTKEEFEDLVGSISKSVRYDTLYLTGPVNLRYNPSTEPASLKSRKRKSKGSSTTQPAKKPRGRGKKSQPDPYETAKGYVESVLASPETFDLPEDDEEIREMITTIVRYTKSLEGSVAVASRTGQDAPPPKTPEQIQEEASRIKNLINRGIKKLMSWKPTCKEGRAKYAFDGVCPDPRVFGAVFGLDGPPVWVTKKYNVDEFENFVGHIRGEVRYAYLFLTGDVRVQYNSETGEFTASGKYGKH